MDFIISLWIGLKKDSTYQLCDLGLISHLLKSEVYHLQNEKNTSICLLGVVRVKLNTVCKNMH